MAIVIVASKNPVKIAAVQTAFEKVFPNETFTFQGESAPSGVADQPMTDLETKQGAINRTTHIKQTFPEANYWVGIEGGVENEDSDMHCFAWIIIRSNTKTGKAKTSTFILPSKVADLVNQGTELGHADDIVFGRCNSKQSNGAVGLLTKDLITRTTYYVEAIILALIPFSNEELY